MKTKLGILICCFLFNTICKSQSIDFGCVKVSGKYKVLKAYGWVDDSTKMEMRFTIDFKLDTMGIKLNLYIPGNSTKLFFKKDKVTKCTITNNDFKAIFESKVLDVNNPEEFYNTSVSFEKKDKKYIMTIESFGVDKSKMELHLIQKSK